MRWMSCHVDDGIAVGEGYTCKIPEDDHESPLFVEHVPCLRDALFALGASIDVETGSQNHECHVGSGDHPPIVCGIRTHKSISKGNGSYQKELTISHTPIPQIVNTYYQGRALLYNQHPLRQKIS